MMEAVVSGSRTDREMLNVVSPNLISRSILHSRAVRPGDGTVSRSRGLHSPGDGLLEIPLPR